MKDDLIEIITSRLPQTNGRLTQPSCASLSCALARLSRMPTQMAARQRPRDQLSVVLPQSWSRLRVAWVELPEFELNSTLVERVATESTTVVTAFGLRLLYLVGRHTKPNNSVSVMSEIIP